MLEEEEERGREQEGRDGEKSQSGLLDMGIKEPAVLGDMSEPVKQFSGPRSSELSQNRTCSPT